MVPRHSVNASRVSPALLIKNALANVASGAAGALLSLLLPPILLRFLSPDVYGIWALILQVGAYTGLLNFGLQVAVGRFVAHNEALGELDRRDSLVSTGFVGLLFAAILGIASMALISQIFPLMFPQLPVALREDAQKAMAWVGISLAMGLPFSVYMGIFIGRQQNTIPGFISILSRLATGVVLVWMVSHQGTLVSMARSYAFVNLLTYAAQFYMHYKHNRDVSIRRDLVDRFAVKELCRYCFSLNVWNVAMLMISGLDLAVVGRVDFSALSAYSIAISLVTFIIGLQNAVFNVLVPAGAILGAREDEVRLQQLLFNASKLGVVLLAASSLPLLLGGELILSHYVGKEWIGQGLVLLQILVVSNFIRLTATPYAVLLIGTGQQRIILATPFVEGLFNLIFSVLLGIKFGAVGVALGTLIGACAGVICNIYYNFPRTRMLVVNTRHYLVNALVKPLLTIIPVFVIDVFRRYSDFSFSTNIVLYVLGVVFSVVLIWRFILSPEIKSMGQLKFLCRE